MKNILKTILMVVLLLMGTMSVSVAAKNPAKSTETSKSVVKTEESVVSSDEFDFKQITARLKEIEQSIKTDDFTKQTLDEDLSFLNTTELALDNAVRRLEKEQVYAQEALAAFGETSEDEEDEAIAEMREKYASAVSGYKNKLIEANLLKTEVMRVTAVIGEARNRIFIGNLVAEKNALVVPKTFFRAISDAAVFFFHIAKSPVEWYKNLSDETRNNLYHKSWYVILIIGFALFLGLFVRSYIIRHWGYHRIDEMPTYGQKVLGAFATALAYGVIPSLLTGGCLLWEISNEELIQSTFGKALASAFYYALFMILARAAIRVVLAPWNGRWRLFNITDERAEKVFRAMTLTIILFGVSAYLLHITRYFEASEALTLLLQVGADAVKAFSFVLVTVSMFGEIKNKSDEDMAGDDDNVADDGNESMSTGARVILFACIFALITFGTSLFGYPDLASFIFNRFFASIVFVGIFVVIRTMILDILRRGIVFWAKTFRMRRRLLSKVDLLMSLLITPILLLFLCYMLLRLWGMPGSVLLYGIKKLIFGFKVGGINISLLAIFTGLLVFVISITLVRMFRRRLANNLLARINMDEGIKHSLISGVSFTGFVISVILAIVAMGVDLSNLAVIAGALSVGIGFGLQDIIKNLVAGIIILFERPFKAGDWVIIGGEEGKIKQINIRSTELETWTKRSVIIPNATLISSSVMNLTHGDYMQRQSILVGVSYDSDVDKVKSLLLECVRSHKRVLKTPAPMVLFKDFGASSLDFELRFHVADVRVDFAVNSDLRYIILNRFREEGIEIAYPQLVIHQGN